MTSGEKKLILSRIKGSIYYADLQGCDLVIECIRSKSSDKLIELRRSVFKNIEEEGVAALVDGLDSKKEIIELVEEYNQRNTMEARVVKAADNLDALAQAKGVPGAQNALKYFKQVYHITKFDWHKKAVDLILSGEVEPARDWQKK